jgi:hypothetical protein
LFARVGLVAGHEGGLGGEEERVLRRGGAGLCVQGAILQNSLSAENFSDKTFVLILWTHFHPKATSVIYMSILDNYLIF